MIFPSMPNEGHLSKSLLLLTLHNEKYLLHKLSPVNAYSHAHCFAAGNSNLLQTDKTYTHTFTRRVKRIIVLFFVFEFQKIA